MAIVKAGGVMVYRVSPTIQFLLLQTSYGKHHWTPPKGHIDPGEDDLTAAVRETEEEAGLKASQYKIDPNINKTLNYKAHGKPKCVTYWVAELLNKDDKITLSHEHDQYLWCDLEKAKELVQFPEMQVVLSEVYSYLSSKHEVQKNVS